jgi:DNA polymerase-3 subunit delta'
VADLSHPDLHWIVPVPRPKASDAEKQVEEVAEAIGDVMAERRKNPLYEAPDGMAMHGVATVRLIQRRAAMKSVEGGPRLFIIGHAERLVPQESAQEAANALLKLLEEPPPNCYFVLTATDAGRLLPTIRSRVVSLRLGRLTDAEVRSFLAAHLTERDSAELERLVSQVDGAIGAAIGAAEGGTKAAAAAKEVMDAVRSGPLAMAARALKQNPWSARGDFSAMLEALEAQLGAAAKAAAGTGNGERGTGSRMVQLLEAMGHVAKAREAAQGNVNPQLLLSVLQDDLTRALDVRRET